MIILASGDDAAGKPGMCWVLLYKIRYIRQVSAATRPANSVTRPLMVSHSLHGDSFTFNMPVKENVVRI